MTKSLVFLSHAAKDHAVLSQMLGCLKRRINTVIRYFLSGRDIQTDIARESTRRRDRADRALTV